MRPQTIQAAKRLKTVRFSYSGDGKNEDKG